MKLHYMVFVAIQVGLGVRSLDRRNVNGFGTIWIAPIGSYLDSSEDGEFLLLPAQNSKSLVVRDVSGLEKDRAIDSNVSVVDGALDLNRKVAYATDYAGNVYYFRFGFNRSSAHWTGLRASVIASASGNTAVACRGAKPSTSQIGLIDDRTGRLLYKTVVKGQVSQVVPLPNDRIALCTYQGGTEILSKGSRLRSLDLSPAAWGGPTCLSTSADGHSLWIATSRGFATKVSMDRAPAASFKLADARPVGIGELWNGDVIVGFHDGRVDRYAKAGKLLGTWSYGREIFLLTVRSDRIIVAPAPGK